MKQEENYTLTREFFFDTYAFVEILRGSKNYESYFNSGIVTTKLNLFELFMIVCRENGEEKAEIIFDKYFPFARDFEADVIKDAAKFKISLNKRDVSMTDCIGYMFAKQLGIKFLTGDKAFEGLDGVEFVK